MTSVHFYLFILATFPVELPRVTLNLLCSLGRPPASASCELSLTGLRHKPVFILVFISVTASALVDQELTPGAIF